jgi:hypothetical protein
MHVVRVAETAEGTRAMLPPKTYSRDIPADRSRSVLPLSSLPARYERGLRGLVEHCAVHSDSGAGLSKLTTGSVGWIGWECRPAIVAHPARADRADVIGGSVVSTDRAMRPCQDGHL